MIKGKTESGFGFAISDDVLDDWKTLKILREIDKGNTAMIVDAVNHILGDDLEAKLEAHIIKKEGRCSATSMTKEFLEILNSTKSGKN